ncbi:T9SS type B sorting domain-containing protein [Polaribacter sp. MSW13]|uniref:T9SS type B sorting domain-containing protein n=1 Tax=Polaribacter marinus TaxID=2916838 RepID=A0A9X1VKW1_9FLAO|nr:T9SS type B sorting domain-containing protein [Polaribacter marinus]MCI2227883.1 T9SS type B sorting domain-containing protein [Polaribacter marinus]
MTVLRGSSSISDPQGNLLFYSDGETIWNKNHEIMINGEGLFGDLGNTQSSIIIPKPNSTNTYYIFTTQKEEKSNPLVYPGIYHSEIEFSNTYPLGRVKFKNMRIANSTTNKITAVHHKNGEDIWVISYGSDSYQGVNDIFYATLITKDGVNRSPINSQIEHLKFNTSLPGEMKASPDGSKIALYNDGVIYLLNFNNETGELTKNKFTTIAEFVGGYSSYGLSFSPDSKLLYYSANYADRNGSSYRIMQLPLDHPDEYYKGEPIFITEPNRLSASINLGSDGKIYVAQVFYESLYDENDTYLGFEFLPIKTIGVINEPNKLGVAADYTHDVINLEDGFSFRGLPNFIQSYFRNRIVSENTCVTDTFHFSLDAYNPITAANWDFGDGNGFTSTDLNTSYQYATPGKYIVTCIVTINGTDIPFYKEIVVYPLPEVTPDQELIQCDINNDGVDYFNLFNIADKVVRNPINTNFIFYRNRTDAENNQNSIANPEAFENESNPQELFVRVISDKGCASITNFFIESKFVSLGNIDEMFTCDSSDQLNGDSNGAFDLREKRREIRQNFSLDNTNKIRFYPTLIDAQTTSNLLPEYFISPSTTIYVRVDNDLGCGGMEPISLTVNTAPIINLNDSYTICDIPSQHPPIILDGNSFNHRYEWKDENGNIISTNREYTLNTTGNFSLTAYRTENGIECSSDKEFTVINPDAAIFNQIIVDTETENNTIFVSLNGNSNYEFSLDNTSFFGNGLDYTFNNVNPGLRTIYVRDLNNCEPPIQTNVSVIGYQKFFTPNGDGNNDYWNVKGLDSTFFKSVKIIIFDRFGNIVHTITEFGTQGWDGTYNGKLLTSNSYWFKAEIVDLEDNHINESGNFSLVRK